MNLGTILKKYNQKITYIYLIQSQGICTGILAQMVKNLPAMEETWVQSLGWEDPLEKGVATHSSVLAWRIPWTEEPGTVHSVAKSCTRLSSFTFHLLRTAA